jgi:hypothetical protein
LISGRYGEGGMKKEEKPQGSPGKGMEKLPNSLPIPKFRHKKRLTISRKAFIHVVGRAGIEPATT